MRQKLPLLALALCAALVDGAHAARKYPLAYGDYLGDLSKPATLRNCDPRDRISISKELPKLGKTSSEWRSFCYGRPAPIPLKRAPKRR